MTRRDFAGVLTLAGTGGLAVATALDEQDGVTLYYVDGYHGGVRGHMPMGCWRDILNALQLVPEWKICLEIEPLSWVHLRRLDPDAYSEWKRMIVYQPEFGRIEVVSGTYSQPYNWAISGESNIRQLLRGRELTRQHFPGVAIDTYAVQEPCWTSCLPQILRSLGYTGAVLKNPSTTWAGYSTGMNADLVNWVGPDGTSIPAVPRYACEELYEISRTEAQTGSIEYTRKCLRNGIRHPAGMAFQDLGWAARPSLCRAAGSARPSAVGPKCSPPHVRYVTWREYIHRIADKPMIDWHFSQENIRCCLAWGEKTLHLAAQQVRSAENRIIVAEKMCAIAAVLVGAKYPQRELEETWDDVLSAQHHDAWEMVTTREDRDNWAWQTAARTWSGESTCAALITQAAEAMAAGDGVAAPQSVETRWVRVFNTLGTDRTDLVEMPLATDPGTRTLRVTDAVGNVLPSQLIPTRRYMPGNTIGAGTLLFRARVPAMGYTTYRVGAVYREESEPHPEHARAAFDGKSVIVESDLYRIRLDGSRGGAITGLYAKDLAKEYTRPASERLFNEYRGYFIEEQKWFSSADRPGRLEIMENGPVRVRVAVSGEIAGHPFRSEISVTQGQRRLDFSVVFQFDRDTWIGDPWDIKPEDRRKVWRRSYDDDRWKLQALFPADLKAQVLYKNAPFDVCRSENTDTFFQGWNHIKHNIILNWVDIVDGRGGHGLALFSDHTGSYGHGPDHPLSLILGWGWEGGSWWGRRPLHGQQRARYALVTHAGTWERADLWKECAAWNEPTEWQLMTGRPKASDQTRSLLRAEKLDVSAVMADGTNLLVRLFNADEDSSPKTVSFGLQPARVDLVELSGKVIEPLEVLRSGSRYEVRLAIPRFGIRTLRVHGFVTQGKRGPAPGFLARFAGDATGPPMCDLDNSACRGSGVGRDSISIGMDEVSP